MFVAVAIPVGVAIDMYGKGAIGGDVQVVNVWRATQLLEVLLYADGVVHKHTV